MGSGVSCGHAVSDTWPGPSRFQDDLGLGLVGLGFYGLGFRGLELFRLRVFAGRVSTVWVYELISILGWFGCLMVLRL